MRATSSAADQLAHQRRHRLGATSLHQRVPSRPGTGTTAGVAPVRCRSWAGRRLTHRNCYYLALSQTGEPGFFAHRRHRRTGAAEQDSGAGRRRGGRRNPRAVRAAGRPGQGAARAVAPRRRRRRRCVSLGNQPPARGRRQTLAGGAFALSGFFRRSALAAGAHMNSSAQQHHGEADVFVGRQTTRRGRECTGYRAAASRRPASA